MEDVLIAVCDGLKGLPEAITTTCERTVLQQYIVLRIRNSFRYAGRQHRDGVINALKPFTRPPPEQGAKDRCAEFTAQWGQRYPAMVRLCESSWLNSCRSLSTTRRSGVLSANESINATIPKGREGLPAVSERNRGPAMPVPGYQDLLIQLAAVGHAG